MLHTIFSNSHLSVLNQKENENHNTMLNTKRPFKFEKGSTSSFGRFDYKKTHWTNVQKSKYLLFVCYFREFLGLKNVNQLKWTLFKCMSKFVKTRSPQQCRSHHLKLLKSYKTVQSFIFRALKRFPMLNDNFMVVQEELKNLQQQFKLFSIKLTNQKKCQFNEIKMENKIMDIQQNLKQDKIGTLKTSDDYLETQKYMKNNQNSSFSIYHVNKIDYKKELPNFSEEINDNSDEQNLNKEINNKSSYEKRINPNLMKNIERGLMGDSQKINSQRIKDIYQCQYLYQLWSNKLQQIMASSAFYNMKSCDQQ